MTVSVKEIVRKYGSVPGGTIIVTIPILMGNGEVPMAKDCIGIRSIIVVISRFPFQK